LHGTDQQRLAQERQSHGFAAQQNLADRQIAECDAAFERKLKQLRHNG
jgi:hypothetical protein